MSARTNSARPSPFRLALFWLGVQAVWGALLGISLQARTIELVSSNAIVAYGRLAALGATTAAVVQILVGLISDSRRREGSRRIEFYAIGAIGGSAAIAFFYEARTFVALIVAFVALQGALNLAIGPYQAIIPDFVERARVGKASSWMAALQSAGNAIGALAASFIANAAALAATLGGLLLVTCAATSAHARGLPLRQSTERTEPLRVTRPFVDLFVSRLLVYVGFFTLLSYLLFYVQSSLGEVALAAAKQTTGILIVSFTIVGALGAAIAARPSDRLDKRLVATFGAAGFILALALFIETHALGLAIAATVLAGVGWGVFLVADWAIACRILPSGAMAAAMGVWNLAIVLPQIIAPALTTAVLALLRVTAGTAPPRIAFALALGETLVGIAWLWRLSPAAIGD
ncbi:MAG TPA: MFS transporter [Candidatus Cybelea sp.]|jgi:MFS family permease|nr:MFS transporter [Candidatus Cybelea sp.]